MSHPTWFSRWRTHPMSCAGHVAQGAAVGVLAACGVWELAAVGALWAAGFWLYQGLSFARKVSESGRGDTAGLDCFDLVVGMAPAAIAFRLLLG